MDTWSVEVSPPEAMASASVGSSDRGGAGGRVHLAGDAVHRQAVGPVGRDLQLQHVVGDRERVGQRRRPAASASSSTMIPAWSWPMPTSSSARIMPLDFTPLSLASPSAVPSGMTAPGSATATVWPAATLGAPQTMVRCPWPSSTSHTFSRSASGCFSALSTLPTTKSSRVPHPHVLDPLQLGAGQVEPVGDAGGVQVGVAVLAQPCAGERASQAPNCARKRTSLS